MIKGLMVHNFFQYEAPVRNIFTREFFIGFLLATCFWVWVASEIEIPEYTITRTSICT